MHCEYEGFTEIHWSQILNENILYIKKLSWIAKSVFCLCWDLYDSIVKGLETMQAMCLALQRPTQQSFSCNTIFPQPSMSYSPKLSCYSLDNRELHPQTIISLSGSLSLKRTACKPKVAISHHISPWQWRKISANVIPTLLQLIPSLAPPIMV